MAIRAMTDICLDDVDVVITGSYLRILHSICTDQRFTTDKFVFPMLFTLIQNTLVVHGRLETDAVAQRFRDTKLPNHLLRGHMFQDNFTEMPKETSDGANYFRILQYQLADLNCIVITETDAVLPDTWDQVSDGPPPSLDSSALSEEIPLDIQPVPAGPDVGRGWRPRLVPAGKFAERRTWAELKLAKPEFTDVASHAYFCDTPFAIYGIRGGYDKNKPDKSERRWMKVNGLEMHDYRSVLVMLARPLLWTAADWPNDVGTAVSLPGSRRSSSRYDERPLSFTICDWWLGGKATNKPACFGKWSTVKPQRTNTTRLLICRSGSRRGTLQNDQFLGSSSTTSGPPLAAGPRRQSVDWSGTFIRRFSVSPLPLALLRITVRLSSRAAWEASELDDYFKWVTKSENAPAESPELSSVA